MASTSTSGSKRKAEDMDAFDEVAPSASTSASKLMKKPSYDVFINHRGPDVKSTLATALYDMLTAMALSVFLDAPELEYGDFLPRTIEAAMRSALLHIAIFSERYAESPWCLAELTFMLKSGVRIIPIFYYVDPTDLRYIDKGKGMFAKAFEEHKQKGRYSPEKLQEWKDALNNVSFCSGEIIKHKDDEMRLLERITSYVVQEIKQPLKVAEHPVGLEEIVKDFEMNILQSVEDDQCVKIIGIWGMGGSGKTTLAKELYNKNSSLIKLSSFVSNIRDASTKGLLYKRQEKILKDLGVPIVGFDNIEEGMETLSRHLRSVKVLIILDDVDHVNQLAALMPAKDRLESGSLIIVTTREYDVLKSWGITSIYKMKPLDQFYAEQLFCWHAFAQSFPQDGFQELVKMFLKACDRLPLSLKVIGAQLYGESNKECWESLLHKITRILPIDIQQILKISYDALDYEEKEMFLDVACFFIGERYTLPIEVWNGLGLSGLQTWKRLLNKCLVECDHDSNFINMHDHIRDLGRDIAIKQSPYRFWLHQQIINIHEQRENRISIHGIIATQNRLQWSTSWGREKNMPEMFRITDEVDFRVWCSDGELNVKTNRGIWSLSPSLVGLKYLVINGDSFNQVMGEVSRELVWLRWFEIGQRNLPSGLLLKKLRVLELYEDYPEYHLEELWGETDEAPVQLSEMIISNCNKFQGFPKSIGHLKHLKRIVISQGYNVTSLPDEFCFLRSLEHLVLDDCKMQTLPSNFGNLSNLRYLSFCHCGELMRLPVSFKNLILLEYLSLNWCSQLTFTPEDLNIMENMTKLEYFYLIGCKQLRELPHHITNQTSLRELDFSETCLRELPDKIGQLSRLGQLYIEKVLSTSLPTSLGGLSSLTVLYILDCPNLDRLPDSLGGLSSLEILYVQSCPVLERVPESLGDLSSLKNLDIIDCPKLERQGVKYLPKAIRQLSNLQNLHISSCPISGSSLSVGSSNMNLISLRETEESKISFSQGCCTHLKSLHVENNPHLEEIEALPRTLQSISLEKCEMLKDIPSLAQLTSLTSFVLSGCCKFEKIEVLPRTLESISLTDCEMLKSIPSFERSTSLRKFVLYGCCKIEKIEGIENCTELTELSVDTCWEVPGIESLERVQNLKELALRANKGSVIERCIQRIQNLPDEITICARAVPEAATLVDSLLPSNLVIVDSISNQSIKSRPKLANGGSNGDTFMLCLVTNCVSSQRTLYIGNLRRSPLSINLEKGRWAWVAVITERILRRTGGGGNELFIYTDGECGGEDEVEKGLTLRGEEQTLTEALRSLLPLFQSR